MAEPIWIGTALALAIHEKQLAEHGGIAGVRDKGLLESAIARPRHLQAYCKTSPPISQLAAVVSETIVMLNGYEPTANDETMCTRFIHLAEGSLSEPE